MTIAAKAHWPTRRLGELAEFRNGVNYNKSSFGVGVKVVGVSDFRDYTKPRYAELEQINPEGIVTELADDANAEHPNAERGVRNAEFWNRRLRRISPESWRGLRRRRG